MVEECVNSRARDLPSASPVGLPDSIVCTMTEPTMASLDTMTLRDRAARPLGQAPDAALRDPLHAHRARALNCRRGLAHLLRGTLA